MTIIFSALFWVTQAILQKPKLPTPYKAHCVLRWMSLTIQMWKVFLLCCTLSITDQERRIAFWNMYAVELFWQWTW